MVYFVLLLLSGCSLLFDASDGQAITLNDAANSTFTACKDVEVSLPSASGEFLIDPDGDGPEPAATVYCDLERAGGGWQLVSYLSTDFAELPTFIDGQNYCTGVQTSCAGHIPINRLSSPSQVRVLILDMDMGHWLIYKGFSGSPSGALSFLTGSREISSDEQCEDAVCGSIVDPNLEILETSPTLQLDVPDGLSQTWLVGGWQVLGGGNANANQRSVHWSNLGSDGFSNNRISEGALDLNDPARILIEVASGEQAIFFQ